MEPSRAKERSPVSGVSLPGLSNRWNLPPLIVICVALRMRGREALQSVHESNWVALSARTLPRPYHFSAVIARFRRAIQ